MSSQVITTVLTSPVRARSHVRSGGIQPVLEKMSASAKLHQSTVTLDVTMSVLTGDGLQTNTHSKLFQPSGINEENFKDMVPVLIAVGLDSIFDGVEVVKALQVS